MIMREREREENLPSEFKCDDFLCACHHYLYDACIISHSHLISCRSFLCVYVLNAREMKGKCFVQWRRSDFYSITTNVRVRVCMIGIRQGIRYFICNRNRIFVFAYIVFDMCRNGTVWFILKYIEPLPSHVLYVICIKYNIIFLLRVCHLQM